MPDAAGGLTFLKSSVVPEPMFGALAISLGERPDMLKLIVYIFVAPVIAGLFFNHFFYERFPWLARWMPRLSMVGIAIIIAIITAAGRDSLLSVGLALLLATALHNAAGYFLGYWASRLSGLDRQSCRTIALEVGLQNSGLASGLALEMGKVATMGLAPAVFGPLMNVTGSGLASWWRERG